MSEKNLSKQRSVQRWILAYQAIALVAVCCLYPMSLHALEHPLLGSNPALLRLERWDVGFLKSTAGATAGWLCAALVLMMALSVWRIYSLMGVHLKEASVPAQAATRKKPSAPAAPATRSNSRASTRQKRTTGRASR